MSLLLCCGTEPCIKPAGPSSLEASPVPGTHVARRSVGLGIHRLHTTALTHPAYTRLHSLPLDHVQETWKIFLAKRPGTSSSRDRFSAEGRKEAEIYTLPISSLLAASLPPKTLNDVTNIRRAVSLCQTAVVPTARGHGASGPQEWVFPLPSQYVSILIYLK